MEEGEGKRERGEEREGEGASYEISRGGERGGGMRECEACGGDEVRREGKGGGEGKGEGK